MSDKRTFCVCADCGNEADMILTCSSAEIGTGSKKIDILQEDEENCRICGNEANMVLNF